MSKNIPVIKLTVYQLLWHKFIQYERSSTYEESDDDQIQIDKTAILTILRITFNKDPLMIKE